MKMGVIGYGARISNVIDGICKYQMGAEIAAITDVNLDAVKNRLKDKGIDENGIKFYRDPDEMLESEKLDGVLIGTRCSLHAKMAAKVLKKNIPLFLEKPVATSMEDLITLRDAMRASKSEAVVSFPLRVTPMVSLAKEIIDSGKIGTVEHVQAINNVPYGGVYYHNWYRDENETGGLFLQKATHDFDYINYLVGVRPVKICAVVSKQIFRGDRPEGLKCDDCSEKETCMESPFYIKNFAYGVPTGDMCSFAVDTGNEDSGSAIIKYETGMHVSYSQNFFARKKAAARGARLFGYKGTLEFDWYTDELKVYMHHTPRVDTYRFDAEEMAHFGGDSILAYNFLKVMQGEAASVSPLEAGLMSVLMCLMARESARCEEFKEIKWPDE